MRYYHSKQRYLESRMLQDQSGTKGINKAHEHIEDRVELSDTAKYKREMLDALNQYRD